MSGLLQAIGGECAGALTLTSSEDAPPLDAPEYSPISSDELKALAVNHVLPALDGQRGLRLSLAGAQDKLPVRIDEGTISVPIGSAPSTHLLKFPNTHYKHLPANEVFTLMLARAVGLPVVSAEWWPLREGMCVVARYDRVTQPASGRIQRLHQEDLCQALGLRSTAKYEKEGGPTFERCFELVRSHSSDPFADGQNLLRWFAFNVVAFNADGHAKNLSLLYSGRAVRLAPFYDLLCTRPYERLSADLAMSVSGEADPTQVRRTHWETLARTLGIGPRVVMTTVREVAESLAESLAGVSREFTERHGTSPALEQIVPKVRRQAKRVLQLLT